MKRKQAPSEVAAGARLDARPGRRLHHRHPPDATRSWSLITAESPLQCITAEDPPPARRSPGLKMFRDDLAGADFAFLFLPRRALRRPVRRAHPTHFRSRGFVLNDRWSGTTTASTTSPATASHGPLLQQGRAQRDRGPARPPRPHQRQLFNEWWIGKIQAFRQRALEMPDEEEVDDDLDIEGEAEGAGGDLSDPASLDEDSLAGIFTSAPDALGRSRRAPRSGSPSPRTSASSSTPSRPSSSGSPSPRASPAHHHPDAANAPPRRLDQREEHVYDIEDRRDRADSGWAETLAMAFEFQNDTERADVAKIEPIWGPAERFSLSERADAASKLYKILPNEAILTDVLQYAPRRRRPAARAARG